MSCDAYDNSSSSTVFPQCSLPTVNNSFQAIAWLSVSSTCQRLDGHSRANNVRNYFAMYCAAVGVIKNICIIEYGPGSVGISVDRQYMWPPL